MKQLTQVELEQIGQLPFSFAADYTGTPDEQELNPWLMDDCDSEEAQLQAA